MTAMDFLPSDLDQVPTNFLDMIENDVNSQLLDLESLSSEKLNDFVLNNDLSAENLNLQLDFDQDSKDVNNWIQNLQNWNDSSKVPQSLIDASNENLVENNNPNLLVNPQSVLPVLSTQQVQSSQNVNQLNVRNSVPIKINGQDAILTPTQHPQIQYVTVQTLGTDSLNNSQIGYSVQPVTVCPQVPQIRTTSTPSQNSPVLVEHLRNGYSGVQIINNKVTHQKKTEKVYPKPIYSYSCLIAMALKNSKTGNLPVSEIYTFMTENFPYFKTAPDGWKNSVRHNLSLNKCFAKVESAKPMGAHTRKGCLWALNPAKILKMEEEIVKWRKKDPESVKHSMAKPENLELIEQGKAGLPNVSSSSNEPDPPILVKSEPPTPVKKEPPPAPQAKRSVVVTRESAVLVKTEPESEPVLIDLKDLASLGQGFDPSLTDLALQNSLWDDDMQTDTSVSLSAIVPQLSAACQPSLQSPTRHSVGTQYHGNINYTCAAAASPVQPNSPMYNTTPTKNYPQTPTKVYPQTPTRIILA